MSAAIAFPPGILPWSNHRADEQRFRRILGRTLGVCLALALALPWLPVREPDRSVARELPPPMAKLLLDRPLPMPTPPRPAEPPRTSADAAKPADAPKLEVSKAEPAKVPVPEARRPQPDKPPGEIGEARRRAAGVGLLAMANELAEIRGAPVAVQLKSDIKAGPGVGTGSGPGVGAGFEQGIPTRAMITSNATRGSGGINTAGYSRDTGGGGLAGRATTLVEGVAGGGGGGGYGGGGAVAGGGSGGKGAGGTVQRGASGKASRSIEEIRLVFERNKGSIYALYNRALREDPTLQGKIVLELRIAPSGQITELRLLSSELRAAELEGKLLARIRQFDFGAKDVEVMTVTWPVDFLPS